MVKFSVHLQINKQKYKLKKELKRYIFAIKYLNQLKTKREKKTTNHANHHRYNKLSKILHNIYIKVNPLHNLEPQFLFFINFI